MVMSRMGVFRLNGTITAVTARHQSGRYKSDKLIQGIHYLIVETSNVKRPIGYSRVFTVLVRSTKMAFYEVSDALR